MSYTCQKCGKGGQENGGYLHRVNETGVKGIWECRPSCDADNSFEMNLLAAIKGDELDEDDPMWLINAQIKGLLEGDGAGEDHEDVKTWLRSTGLPEDTVKRVHKAIVHGDTKVKPEVESVFEPAQYLDERVEMTPAQLRAAGRPYCPKCYTFGSSHRKDCPNVSEGMSKHIRQGK